MRLAVSSHLNMCLCGYRLFVVEVNLIRQETVCVLNTAGWTLPVHTVPVCLSFCLTFIFPPAVQSLTLSLSLIHTCCASLLLLFHFCLYYSFFLSTRKTFRVSSPPLLLLPCCYCVSFVSDAQAPLVIQ